MQAPSSRRSSIRGPPSKLSSWNKSRLAWPPSHPLLSCAQVCIVCMAVCMTRSRINSLRLSTLSREAEALISKSNYETILGSPEVELRFCPRIILFKYWTGQPDLRPSLFSVCLRSSLLTEEWGSVRRGREGDKSCDREKACSSINHLKPSGSEWGWLWLSVDALLMRKIYLTTASGYEAFELTQKIQNLNKILKHRFMYEFEPGTIKWYKHKVNIRKNGK